TSCSRCAREGDLDRGRRRPGWPLAQSGRRGVRGALSSPLPGRTRAPPAAAAPRRTRPSLREKAFPRLQEVRAVRALTLAIALALALAAPSEGRRAPTLPYPGSLAAIGDSWTGPSVAADSWATGTNKAVESQYLRILAHNPAVRGHAYNLAEAHAA